MLSIGVIKNSRYRVKSVIGKGGTSVVYLVTDVHIGKDWAMKEIVKRDGMAYCLAEREIEMLRAIDFKMFPRIVDAWQEMEALYIISDYVEGVSLNMIVSQKGVTKYKCIEWARSILEGLEYLHGLSPPILYLDLKPENIIVCSDGTLKLIDFGIASRQACKTLSMGTSGYAPPEQYGSKKVDYRTDIYAFGATYYAMRCKAIPAKEPEQLLDAINKTQLLSKKEKCFLSKCIRRDPNDRFGSVYEVKHSLNQIGTNRFNSKKIFTFIEIVILLMILGISLYIKADANRKKIEAANEMISAANIYIKDDEYTRQGIKVITTFLNSGCLPEETEEEFTYEVARNYFVIQQNYKEALKYFERLDEEKYAEIKYYKKLCQLEMRFDFDETEALNCIGQFYRDMEMESVSVKKYENILFISRCYEKYEKEKGEAIRKSITVLEGAKPEIKREYENSGSDEYKNLCEKYDKRLGVLYLKASRARI